MSIFHETLSLTRSTFQRRQGSDKKSWRRPGIQTEESQALPGYIISRLWRLALD